MDNKQIEEMKKHINNAFDLCYKTGESDITKAIAEELIKYYQPKLPEGSVVISKEENEARENAIDSLQVAISSFTRLETLYKIKCKELEIAEEQLKIARKQAVKEFAKKLKMQFQDLGVFYSTNTIEKRIKEIAKEMGVDIYKEKGNG